MYVPVTEYISEISTRDKHRQIYKLFVHICSTLFFYMCIFRHFECLDGNENYIYKFVVHLNKDHLSFFLSLCSSVVHSSILVVDHISYFYHQYLKLFAELWPKDYRIYVFEVLYKNSQFRLIQTKKAKSKTGFVINIWLIILLLWLAELLNYRYFSKTWS